MLDIQSLFLALNREGVVYILVGTLGAIAQGARLHTHDLDLCIATDAANLQRTSHLLQHLEAKLLRVPQRGLDSVDLNDWTTLRLDDPSEHHLFSTRFGDIDILPQPLGPDGELTTYAQLQPKSVTVIAFSVEIRVAAFSEIAASKLAVNRPLDSAVADELRHLLQRREKPDYGLETYHRDRMLLKPYLDRLQPENLLGFHLLHGGYSGALLYKLHYAASEVILKITPRDRGAMAVERARRELIFYRELADQIPLRVPRVLMMHENSDGIMLLMPVYRASPVEDFLGITRQLGQFHAVFWGRTDQLAGLSWLGWYQRIDLSTQIRQAAIDWQALRDRALITQETNLWLQRVLTKIDLVQQILDTLPLTVCHGDCIPVNILLDDENRLIWTDWQEVRLARGPEDLAFFLQRASVAGAAIPRDDVISAYHQALERYTGQTIQMRDIRRVMDAAELSTRVLYWPAYLATEATAAQMVEDIHRLVLSLGIAV